jgi:hypothetical protein
MAGALTLFAVLAVVVGCGGGGSGSSGGSTSASTSSSNSGNGEASATFLKPGVKSQSPRFGKEADAAELEAVSEVVEENSQARTAQNFALQCATLAKSTVKELEEHGPSLGAGKSCAKTLEKEAATAPKYIFAETMTGPVAALRVKGSQGYALYHGKKGKDYELPVTLEGGQWKVVALFPQEIS